MVNSHGPLSEPSALAARPAEIVGPPKAIFAQLMELRQIVLLHVA